MKKFLTIFYISGFLLLACSNDTEEKKQLTGDHVWKAQTEVLEKAKEVQGVAEELLEEQKKKMEELNKD